MTIQFIIAIYGARVDAYKKRKQLSSDPAGDHIRYPQKYLL